MYKRQVRGTAALARGPLVYCLEHADLPASGPLANVVFEDLELDPARPIGVQHDPDGLAPVTLLAPLRARPAESASLYRPLAGTCTVAAIPYFLWANRAAGPMRVWIPVAP